MDMTHSRQSRGMRRTIDQALRIKIYEFMKPLLIEIADHEYWEYVEGWDDEKVARHFDIGKNSVERIRLAGFGNLVKQVKTKAADPELVARVESLERRVVSMLSTIECHQRQIEKLQASFMAQGEQVAKLYNKLRPLLD
jgi:alpha-galactosidase/6-phospho-beta-glucosidase family protein